MLLVETNSLSGGMLRVDIRNISNIKTDRVIQRFIFWSQFIDRRFLSHKNLSDHYAYTDFHA